MATHIKYEKIIEDIAKSNKDEYVLTQEKAKKLANAELPKSLFNLSYIRKAKNEFCRFVNESGYEVEVITPKIILKKKQ